MIPDKFDARMVQPSQGGGGGHPPGIFPFTITNTYLKENKEKTGAGLVIEMTSDVGKIENWYNVIHPNAKAVEIAQKELSALCHAVNIYEVPFPKNPDGSPIMDRAGFTLRGGKGKMEIAPQTNKDGTIKEGYVEVKKVFDMNGNEPGKPNAGGAPMTQQPGGGWNNNQQPQQQPAPQAQPQQNSGWAQQPQGGAAPQNPAPANSGWATGGGQPQQPAQQPAGDKPAWAR